MTAQSDDGTPPVSTHKRQARRLRITAAVVLVAGIFAADLVYWLGTRSGVSPDVLPLAGEDKAETRKAEELFGHQTIILDQLGRELKKPATQAVLIVVTATLAAGGCFYVARWLDRTPGKKADPTSNSGA